MSKLTFPIKNDSVYVRRDGAVVKTVDEGSSMSATVTIKSPFGIYWVFRDTGKSGDIERVHDLVADYIEAPKTKGHIHASSMLFYAQDATETDTPWERWEWRHVMTGGRVSNWVDSLKNNIVWDDNIEYRRKPAPPVFVSINGINVPQPMQIAPDKGTNYFCAILHDSGDKFLYALWDGDQFDQVRLKNGVCHLTKEAAKIHANALISFTIVK